MRPYLAILKDSFREAMASRVLLVLLIFVTLALLIVAPVSLTETHRSLFLGDDLPSPIIFAAVVRQQAENDEPSPGKQIVQFAQSGENGPFSGNARPWQIVSSLNEILDERALYDPDAWKGINLSEEAKNLVQQNAADLPLADVRRRNRLLLEAAYPELINSSASREIYIGYAWYKADFPLPFSKAQSLGWAFDKFTDYGLGVVGIMIAILVTSASIPRTYEPGAVDLLLSKPLARSGVFLANFVGGCAFILLITTYLIVGMWLICGLRHGYWNHRFLLCIPLLLFLFSIYYSVSALVGVIWKNAIVCVFVTIVFWGFCFLTWGVKTLTENTVMNPRRITHLVAAGDNLVSKNQGFSFAGRFTQIWDESTHTWKNVLRPASGEPGGIILSRATPPTWDSRKNRLLVVDYAEDALEGARDETGLKRCLYVGDTGGDRTRIPFAYVPDDTVNVYVTHDERYVLPGLAGIYEVGPDYELPEVPAPLLQLNQGEPDAYTNIAPDDWGPFTGISMNPLNSSLAVLRGQYLAVYKVGDGGKYAWQSAAQLETPNAGLVAFGGEDIAVSFGDGSIGIYDANTLKLRNSYHPHGENGVAQLIASPDGRWLAAVFEHRRLWLYDSSEKSAKEPGVKRSADVSAAAFTPGGGIAVATAFDHVALYNLDNLAVERTFDPSLETGPWAYWYIIRPIYTIFPKPGELGDVVTYLVSGKETEVEAIDRNPQTTADKLNIWQPILSNVVFLSVILGLACLYVYRKDF